MNKYYVLEKLAQRVVAPADSTGVANSKKTPTASTNGYTAPDINKNLAIAKNGGNFGPGKGGQFSNSARDAANQNEAARNKAFGTGQKTDTPKMIFPHQEAKNNPGPRANGTNNAPAGKSSTPNSGNTGGSFASSFDAYSKRPDAKIGDTFEHNGKKYKFEYSDKKKNEEFMKGYEAKQTAKKETASNVLNTAQKNQNQAATDKMLKEEQPGKLDVGKVNTQQASTTNLPLITKKY